MIKSQSMKLTFSALALFSTQTAFAQRTDDNAVTGADDAFGKSVGGETIGIYHADDVRGFSPSTAGNLRLEGLYIDQQGFLTDRLIDGSTIHVGLSAQGYPFPAPTGIANYDLRKPGKAFVASIGINHGPFGGNSLELDVLAPLNGEKLGISAGIGLYRERNAFGGTPHFLSTAFSIRSKPSDAFEIHSFWSRVAVRDDEAEPLIFMNTEALPPTINRGRFHGQKWAVFSANEGNYGVVTKAKTLGIDVAAGLFRSYSRTLQSHYDLLFDTAADGRVGSRTVIADRGDLSSSTSGEIKLSKFFSEGKRQHLIHATARARHVERRYGGSNIIDLGVSQIGIPDFRATPTGLTFGPKIRETVEQKTFGLGYELRWKDLGEISIGVQKTHYAKQVTDPNPAVIIAETKDSPYLFSATAAVYLSQRLALYGGYVRGLEESDVAPESAINRSEAPPAIRTRQQDIGLRWKPNEKISVVLGYFDVRKPYFNLDTTSVFRQLGQVRNRGAEFSLSGEVVTGVNIVAGSVFLDSIVSGDEVRLGLIGKRPVGTFKLHNLININWHVPWHDPLTLTARFESTSDRTANARNSFVIPARSVTSLGARYRMKAGKVPILIRASVDNVFNKFGWNVGGSGFFAPNGTRRYSLTLAADL